MCHREGRGRQNVQRLACPHEPEPAQQRRGYRHRVTGPPFTSRCGWSGTIVTTKTKWLPLVNDRPTSAYLLNAHGDGVAHYQSRRKDERFYGLGDKAGDLQRNGKRYEMRNLDAMGYNAVSTDPLYNTFH